MTTNSLPLCTKTLAKKHCSTASKRATLKLWPKEQHSQTYRDWLLITPTLLSKVRRRSMPTLRSTSRNQEKMFSISTTAIHISQLIPNFTTRFCKRSLCSLIDLMNRTYFSSTILSRHSFVWTKFFIPVLLVFFASCKKESDVGIDIQPEEDIIGLYTTDTMTLWTSTVL